MDPLAQTRLYSLMSISRGDPNLKIGIIDGPIDFSHPDFQGRKIRAVKESQLFACKHANSIACRHGTFITGILSARRGFSAPAICPDCTVLLRPIFRDQPLTNNTNKGIVFPTSTPEELSDAIIEMVDAQARIINLSLGLSSSSLMTYPKLQEAYDYARQQGTIIVAASGNQGSIGSFSLIANRWILPVTACNKYGSLASMSNFGPSVGLHGLMAPGIDITSTASGGGYIRMSGTSFSAAFVTGTIALLWSIFPRSSVIDIIHSVTMKDEKEFHRSIIPKLLNAEKGLKLLKYHSIRHS